jgi:hypothetical protein
MVSFTLRRTVSVRYETRRGHRPSGRYPSIVWTPGCFICCIFNDPVSTSDYIAWNGLNDCWIGSWKWSAICLISDNIYLPEVSDETTEDHSQHRPYPIKDSVQIPPGYNSERLSLVWLQKNRENYIMRTFILWRIYCTQELFSHRNLEICTQQQNYGLNQRVARRQLCERFDWRTVSRGHVTSARCYATQR